MRSASEPRARRASGLRRLLRGSLASVVALGAAALTPAACGDAVAPTFEKFMRFDTNGMSWRRMSPPPSVRCCEIETAVISPRFM